MNDNEGPIEVRVIVVAPEGELEARVSIGSDGAVQHQVRRTAGLYRAGRINEDLATAIADDVLKAVLPLR